MRRVFLGIDPGSVSGALAAIEESGKALYAEDCFGSPAQIWRYFRSMMVFDEEVVLCAIEKVHSMPKQGVSSTFKFGENFGCWQGLLLAGALPYELVTAQQWMKTVLGSSGVTQDGSLEYCKRKFPELKWKRKKDHNRADALCLAEWARAKTLMIPPSTLPDLASAILPETE